MSLIHVQETSVRQRSSEPSQAMIRQQALVDSTVLLMSIEYVKTMEGASRIYFAEKRGLQRPLVINRASRRMDDFTIRRVPEMEATTTQ